MTIPQPASSGDRLPPWVIVLLVVFLTLRVVDLLPARHSARLSQQLAGQVDEKTMSAMLSTNLTTKQAYVASLGKLGDAAPDSKGLQEALKSAETLQTGGQNSPGTARRVIILRALLRRPLFGRGRNGLDPKDAFAPSALAGLSPEESRRYAAEGRLWGEVARGAHLTPARTDEDAAQLRALPNIRWWRAPAQAVLYRSQGNPAQAARYDARARTQALTTLGPLVGMMLMWGALGIVGVGLLLYLAFRRWPGISPPLPMPWPAMPELTPLAERRLRAGDLMGVFVLYLLMPDLIGWLIGGFSIPHLFHFPGYHFAGLLGPVRPRLLSLSAGGHAAALVVLEFFAYLIGAAVPIGLLMIIARRKRASIGEELGWNTHRLGRNLLYGVGGYAISLPLLLLAGSVGGFAGSHLHAPTPSNPAIPLLASATSPWVQAMLVGLATVAAPLTEEFLFRGVFYNAAKLRVGVWPAIVLTGLIFGFVHPVGIAAMLPLATLGGVFAWMAETRKSLAPSILAHCFQNSFVTLMLLLALAG
jgi:membrane protease YdiL (CAAX protease family)